MALRRRTFVYDYRAPVESIWAAMADTARYNEAAELPRHVIEEQCLSNNNMRFIATAKLGPITLVWDDLPCNWVRNRWFRHARKFSTGPLASMTAELRLEPTGTGCRGYYTIEATPAGPIGSIILATGFFASVNKMFAKLSQSAERFALGAQDIKFPIAPPKLNEASRKRVASIRQQLDQLSQAHGLADRLVELVTTAPETELQHIRPLALARLWGVEVSHAVEVCLEATRLGLLELHWNMLCPRCRIAKSVVRGLDELPKGAHCGTCNIDYGRNFARNVELVFRPSPLIRTVALGEFCLLGPMSTPHILAHVTLAPGDTRDVEIDVGPGTYRLRTLEAGPEEDVDFEGGRFPSLVIEPDSVFAGVPSPAGIIRMENRTPWERTAVVEDRVWVADALTADRATTMQAFRDLFSNQVLRPGDEVAIERIALLFSDLEGSTALYGRIGDARAYHLVREHFAFMQAIIRKHDGTIVKTIGDAVMAAFAQPVEALQAAIEMQQKALAQPEGERVRIKLGVHVGPCIAVTLNDRLDYFGSTVNMAARLEALSNGDDVIVSKDLAAGPMSGQLLKSYTAVEENAPLKGFAEPVPYLRLRFR